MDFLNFGTLGGIRFRCLAQHFKVVVPDLRGYNDSDKPEGGYDLDTLSADIQGLIEHLGYAKAHIVGHDWGGTIAWHFAQRFPNLLDRLAILNAPHPQQLRQEMLSNLDQLRRSWYLLALQIPALPEWLIRQNLRSIIANLFQEQAIRKGAFTGKDTEIYQAALEKPGALSGALSHYRQWLSPQTWLENLGRSPTIVPIKSPTLVLWGEEDFLFSQRLTEQMDQLGLSPAKAEAVAAMRPLGAARGSPDRQPRAAQLFVPMSFLCQLSMCQPPEVLRELPQAVSIQSPRNFAVILGGLTP